VALRENQGKKTINRAEVAMAVYNFQLRGWHAIAAAVVLVGYMGITTWMRIQPVEDGMRDALREQLLNEYSGRGTKDVLRILAEARDGKPIEPLPEKIEQDIEFPSIGAHGKTGGTVKVVRVEITVDGGGPPDGRTIRYFSMSRKFGGGWMVVGESNAYNYYSDLLP
jgi:hypothetical protein